MEGDKSQCKLTPVPGRAPITYNNHRRGQHIFLKIIATSRRSFPDTYVRPSFFLILRIENFFTPLAQVAQRCSPRVQGVGPTSRWAQVISRQKWVMGGAGQWTLQGTVPLRDGL